MFNNAYVSEYGELSNEILLNVAEILALRLSEGSERIVAAKWVKKFLACDAKSYQNNLSLFICALTKQMLVEPFDEAPQEPRGEWQNFKKIYTPADINRAVRDRMYKDAQTQAYKIEISEDQQEFVAFQEIPYFGAHFYYAFSPTEKINQWQKFNKLKIPRKYVEAMQLADPTHSPIKGRISRKPGERVLRKRSAARPASVPLKAAPCTSAGSLNRQTDKSQEAGKCPRASGIARLGDKKGHRTKTSNLPKLQWEGAIGESEEELAPEASLKKTLIMVPTDCPVKMLPPALQRRMAEAEKQKQERLALKQKEFKERAERSQSQTPGRKSLTPCKRIKSIPVSQAPRKSDGGSPRLSTSSAKTPASSSLRRKALNNATRVSSLRDEIDIALSAADLTESEPEAQPNVPVYYGPKSKTDTYREYIAERKREIEEMERSANIVSQFETPSEEQYEASGALDVLNEIQAAQSIVQNAAVVDEEFSDLVFNLSAINKSASKPVVGKDTIQRLNAIKARAQEIASIPLIKVTKATQSLSTGSERGLIAENAKHLLSLIGETVQEAKETINNLNQIQARTVDDELAVGDLIISNDILINNITGNNLVQPLIEAIQKNSPELAYIAANVAENLNTSIQVSHENDEDIVAQFVVTPAVRRAVNIQDARDDNLEAVVKEADQLVGRVKAIAAMFEGDYKAKDPVVRRYLQQDDIEGDLIDVDAVDTDFEGGTMNEEEFKARQREENERLRAHWNAKQNMMMQTQKSITSRMFDTIADEAEKLDDLTENFEDLLDESILTLDEVIEELEDSKGGVKSQKEAHSLQGIIERAEEIIKNLQNSREEQKPEDDVTVLNSDDDSFPRPREPLIEVLNEESFGISDEEAQLPSAFTYVESSDDEAQPPSAFTYVESLSDQC